MDSELAVKKMLNFSTILNLSTYNILLKIVGRNAVKHDVLIDMDFCTNHQ